MRTMEILSSIAVAVDKVPVITCNLSGVLSVMYSMLFIIVGGTLYSSLVISASGSHSVGFNSYPSVVVMYSLARLFTPIVLLSSRPLNVICVWVGGGGGGGEKG